MKKNFYQLTIHLNPQLKKDNIKKVKDELKEKLEQEEGRIVKTNDLKKTNLTFPIEDFQESFLWDLTVELPPNKVSIVQTDLKEKDEILRLMTTKKPEKEIKKTSQSPDKQKQSEAEESETEEKAEESSEPEPEEDKEESIDSEETKEDEKVELEDIDDKLDDILEDEM